MDIPFDCVNTGFAIVLRPDSHAFGDELRAQLYIVHYVAVVGTNHIAIGIQMRLAVDLRRFTECRPP